VVIIIIAVIISITTSGDREMQRFRDVISDSISRTDFNIKDVIIEDSDWYLVGIESTNRDDKGNFAYMILRKDSGNLKTVLGPGSAFSIDSLNAIGAPESIMKYLYSGDESTDNAFIIANENVLQGLLDQDYLDQLTAYLRISATFDTSTTNGDPSTDAGKEQVKTQLGADCVACGGTNVNIDTLPKIGFYVTVIRDGQVTSDFVMPESTDEKSVGATAVQTHDFIIDSKKGSFSVHVEIPAYRSGARPLFQITKN
jgi:hypothetical protein